eukprot:CAMPEP_0119105234 /NCGR_PEP_ID=MMETSP1180-20130426/3260_1 /TAXON_ID=3052 ORGANISM="Chlamydomonas cf sp, Strain CCMP681" /NCGR_SAMPLE_ID=MMETSP1180 /ASSEMBLY_ACC=CAM_ASM_000741 /LENGTH=425 /DNA_ID=CAMNT_0007090241 /DNA_START=150 /DNA_END=1424 /DNA_ORIENTATION=+
MLRVASGSSLSSALRRNAQTPQPQNVQTPRRRASVDLPRPTPIRSRTSSHHDLLELGDFLASTAVPGCSSPAILIPPTSISSHHDLLLVGMDMYTLAESPTSQQMGSYSKWGSLAETGSAVDEVHSNFTERVVSQVGFKVVSPAPAKATEPVSPTSSYATSPLTTISSQLSSECESELSQGESRQLVTLFRTTIELPYVKELLNSASQVQAQVKAAIQSATNDTRAALPAVSAAMEGARMVGRALNRAAKRVMQVDSSNAVVLPHDALITLGEWGWAEALTLDTQAADDLGCREREDHDLASARVACLQRTAVGDPWVQVGWGSSDPTAVRALVDLRVTDSGSKDTACMTDKAQAAGRLALSRRLSESGDQEMDAGVANKVWGGQMADMEREGVASVRELAARLEAMSAALSGVASELELNLEGW